MYTLSRAVSLRELLLGQAPIILASLLIAIITRQTTEDR